MTALRTFDEALTAVRDVDGWMSPDQAERLYRAALSTRPGDQIVEIGSFRGRSTIVLASAANAEATVAARFSRSSALTSWWRSMARVA